MTYSSKFYILNRYLLFAYEMLFFWYSSDHLMVTQNSKLYKIEQKN